MTIFIDYPKCSTPNCNEDAITKEDIVGYSCYTCYFRRHGIEKVKSHKSNSKSYATKQTQGNCLA